MLQFISPASLPALLRELTSFSAVTDELDHIKDSLYDCVLEVVTPLIPKYTREERQHDSLLCREFEAQRADSIDDNDLELIGDIGHERRDLLHQAVDRGFVTGLRISFTLSRRFRSIKLTFKRVVIA